VGELVSKIICAIIALKYFVPKYADGFEWAANFGTLLVALCGILYLFATKFIEYSRQSAGKRKGKEAIELVEPKVPMKKKKYQTRNVVE
jgi:uncharacterized membrane protein